MNTILTSDLERKLFGKRGRRGIHSEYTCVASVELFACRERKQGAFLRKREG